jgi:hypothetical protein
MLASLRVTPPEGFLEEEVVTTWRAPLKPALKAGLAMNFQAPVRPNLIATQRAVKADASLADLMSKVCADIIRHIEGLSDIETTEFQFTDGATGVLLKYTMPVHGKFSVYQLQAGRLDGQTFTTLTISTEASRLTEDDLKAYLTCIANASVA